MGQMMQTASFNPGINGGSWRWPLPLLLGQTWRAHSTSPGPAGASPWSAWPVSLGLNEQLRYRSCSLCAPLAQILGLPRRSPGLPIVPPPQILQVLFSLLLPPAPPAPETSPSLCLKWASRDFPDGPVAKTQRSQCRGSQDSISGQGTKIPDLTTKSLHVAISTDLVQSNK